MKSLDDRTPKESNNDKSNFVILDDYWIEGSNIDWGESEEAYQRYKARQVIK